MKTTNVQEIQACQQASFKRNGEGGIRTLDTIAGISVFETDAFDHSATSPIPIFISNVCRFLVRIGKGCNSFYYRFLKSCLRRS